MKKTTTVLCLFLLASVLCYAQKHADAVAETVYPVGRESFKRIVSKEFSYFTFGDRGIASLNTYTTVNFLNPSAGINYAQLFGKDGGPYGGVSFVGKAGTTDNLVSLFNGGKPNFTVEATARGFVVFQNKHYVRTPDQAYLDTILMTKDYFAQDTSRSRMEERDSIATLESRFPWATKKYLWANVYASFKQQKLKFIDTTQSLGSEVLDTNFITGSIGLTINRYYDSEYNPLAKLLSCFWQFDMGLEYGNNVSNLKAVDYQLVQTRDTMVNGVNYSQTLSDEKINGYYKSQLQTYFTFKYKFDFYKVLNSKKTFVFHLFAEGRHSWFEGVKPFFNFNFGVGAALNIPNKSNTKNNISFEPYYTYQYTNQQDMKSKSTFGVQMNIPFSLLQ